MRDNALTRDGQLSDPFPPLTQKSETVYGSTARIAKPRARSGFRQKLLSVLPVLLLLTAQQLHADSIQAPKQHDDLTISDVAGPLEQTEANTSPLLQLVSSLACAESNAEASSALLPLESNVIESWQLPNEWNGLDRPPALYAGSLDTAVAKLIATAEKFPELQNRIDALLLSWNYCHIVGKNNFYDLLEQPAIDFTALSGSISMQKRPVEDASLEWLGFQRLGIQTSRQSNNANNPSTSNRYIPGLSVENQKTPRYREESIWLQHIQQCLPHPATGRMYHTLRPFGPTRIDVSLTNTLIAEPYPFNRKQSCGGNESPANEPLPATLISDLHPVTAGIDPLPENLVIKTPPAEPQTQTPAEGEAKIVAESAESTERTQIAVPTIQAADDAIQRLSHQPENALSQLDSSEPVGSNINIVNKLPPSNLEAQKYGKRKRLNKFRIRLVHASRNSPVAKQSLRSETAQTKRAAIEAAIAESTVRKNQSGSHTPALAAATLESGMEMLDLGPEEHDYRAPSHLKQPTTLAAYQDALVEIADTEALVQRQRAKRLSNPKAARVRVSRHSVFRQNSKSVNAAKSDHSLQNTRLTITQERAAASTFSTEVEFAVKKENSKRLHALKVARVQRSRTPLGKSMPDIINFDKSDKKQVADITADRAASQRLLLSPYGDRAIKRIKDKKHTPYQQASHTPPQLLVLSANPKQPGHHVSTSQKNRERGAGQSDSEQTKYKDRPIVIVLSAHGNSPNLDTDKALTTASAETESEIIRQHSKRLTSIKSQRVRASKNQAVRSVNGARQIARAISLATTEKNKRLQAVKIWRVISSRQYRQGQEKDLHVDAGINKHIFHLKPNDYSTADTYGVALRLRLERPHNYAEQQQYTALTQLATYPGGRRYMTTATLWRVLLSREYAARIRIPGWKKAYTYTLTSHDNTRVRMSRRRHGLRIWGEEWFSFRSEEIGENSYDSVAARSSGHSTNSSNLATTGVATQSAPAQGRGILAGSAIDNKPDAELYAKAPETAAAIQSIASAGASPGNSISPVSNAPPYRAAENTTNTSHGFSGSFTLNNTELEFGDTDHYSLTSQLAYKPLKQSYFFARSSLTLNNSDEPLSYTWGVGYDDWHPGTWGFELNNWNPLKPGDGLDIDNAIASVSHKFGWKKLAKNNLASSLALNKSVNSDFAMTWLISWAPVDNWFVRTLLTQSLEGEGLSWAYGFGYNNWRKNTLAIEYNNWGFNKAFDTNFKNNAIVSMSYKWEW